MKSKIHSLSRKIGKFQLKSNVNMSKKKLILVVLISMVMSLATMAQEKKTRGNKESIVDYKTELALSDQQVEQIKAIQKEYLPKMKEARMTRDREVMKKLNDERKTKIEEVLTQEQLEKWKAIKEKKKAEMKNPELKRELRDYKKQNIKPVLLEKRKVFELWFKKQYFNQNYGVQ